MKKRSHLALTKDSSTEIGLEALSFVSMLKPLSKRAGEAAREPRGMTSQRAESGPGRGRVGASAGG